jgi:phage shock protein A
MAELNQTAETLKMERDDLQRRIIELERETAAGQYKDELITSLRDRLHEDRQDYTDRMKFFQNQVEKLQTTTERYVGELVGINRRVGQLEAENRTLRQLPAGRPETRDVRDVYDPNSPRPEESPRDAYGSAYTSEAIHDQPDNQPPFHV